MADINKLNQQTLARASRAKTVKAISHVAIQSESDSTKLLTLFPKEIWLLIFENIDDIQDHQNITQSSTFFRPLLEPLRVTILFENVLEIVVNSQSRKDFTFFEKFALSCRAVCRKWNKEVDTLLQKHNSDFKLVYFTKFGLQKIRGEQDAITFLAHFNPTHLATRRNPLLSRSALVMSRSLTANDLVPRQMMQLLQNYGHHIWHYHLISWGVDATFVERYNELVNMLKFLPNLITLNVTFYYGNTDVRQAELTKVIKEQPIPKLTNIKWVDLNRMPKEVYIAFHQSNPNCKYTRGHL